MLFRNFLKPKYLLLLFLASGAAGAFVAWGPPRLMEKTSTPEFCAGCHVMGPEYESWFLTGVHRNIKCVDCHLPHDNPMNYYIWKGITGTKDIVSFYGRLAPEEITATGIMKKQIQANCRRCHGEMVSRIATDGRNCWSCHRRMNHKVVND